MNSRENIKMMVMSSSKVYSGQTAASSWASGSWSYIYTACVFITGIIFGTVIAGVFLDRNKSSVQTRKVRALLGPPNQKGSVRQRVYKYDVFLSFSGHDTRHKFADHLYNHLIEKGIFAFRDDKTLETGQPFPSRLIEAVQHSRAAIVVFSTHYAKSKWCLEEMSTIARCHRNSTQEVLPVFYDIDPSHVRNHRAAYDEFFRLQASRFADDPRKVRQWKEDMTYLGKLNGRDVRNKSETKEIEIIVQDILDKLDLKFPWITNHLIGLQPRVEEIERRLQLNSEDDKFRVLGILGMGGIGKTTHAKVLYNKIAYQFDAGCFIEDTSKFYREGGGGATEVQKVILRQTLKLQNLEVYSPDRISHAVQHRLCNKELPRKLLIVLDNVGEQQQWDELAIDPQLLGRGSRVVITSRNQDALKNIADYTYDVPLLNEKDARQLFSRKTLKDVISKSGEHILEYAQSLPIAIEKLGYFFNSLDEKNWDEALESMRKCPYEKIMNVLQTSIDELQHNEKEIFLHIACFFGGKRVKLVKHILDSCGISGHSPAIQRIMKKSLITVRNQEIHMHNMLQELGKNLVRRQFPDEPELWSRLWLHEDFEQVLMSKKETNKVKAIVLDQEEDVSKFSHLEIEGLSKMRDLKLLILRHKNFSMNNLNPDLKRLKYILWHGYPFSSFSLSTWRNLVELNLPNSSIQRLWKDSLQEIWNLKRLDLSNSKNLRETPNFKCYQELVRLDFSGCTNLTQVHESIGLLTNLDYLSFRDCSSLAILYLGRLRSLKVLHLSGCTTLKSTPNFRGLSNLRYLDLERCTSLSRLHESIGHLKKLEYLSLQDCTNLATLDLSLARLKFLSLRGCTNLSRINVHINNMTSLQTLDLSGCKNLGHLPLGHKVVSSSSCPESMMVFLDSGFRGLRRRIPNAIGELRCLERLNLERSYFSYVTETDTIKRLSKLAYLNLSLDLDTHWPGEEGILEGYPPLVIIGQEHMFSASTENALDAPSCNFMMISKMRLAATLSRQCCSEFVNPANGQ